MKTGDLVEITDGAYVGDQGRIIAADIHPPELKLIIVQVGDDNVLISTDKVKLP